MAYTGRNYEPVTDEMKEDFLDLIAQGFTRPEAASALGTNARKLRAICNPESEHYDAKFAKRYAKITEKDGEHETGLVERLRTAGIERAVRSSDRLLEKYSIIHDPDWAVHKPQSMQLNFNNVEQLGIVLPEMSDEELLQLKERIEEKKRRRELPPGPPDIDVDPK